MKLSDRFFSAVIFSIIFTAVGLLFQPTAFSDPYWTADPDLVVGAIAISPPPPVCVGTEVILSLPGAEDKDTKHICTENNREITELHPDTTFRIHWNVTRDGQVVADETKLFYSADHTLSFTASEPGEYVIVATGEDKHEPPPPGTPPNHTQDDSNDPISVTRSFAALRVDLDGQELQPPPPPQNWKDVPEDKEDNPGVLLAEGKTKLLVRDPGRNMGKYEISWPDLSGNKKLLLVGGPGGPDSPLEVDCAGSWPKEYRVVAAGDWSYSDSVDVTLTHSLVPCQDVVKLTILKVDLEREPRYIAAETVWTGIDDSMQRSTITVSVNPPEAQDDVIDDISLEIKEVTENPEYTPGEGTLAQDPSDKTKWTYTPFTEPKTEKHPRPKRVWIVPKYQGNECGDTQWIQVRHVFLHLTQEDEYDTAWQYAKWKYDIDTANLSSISYDSTLEYDGRTYCSILNVRTCKLGPSAFDTENMCASTLGHENVHGGQPYDYFQTWFFIWHWTNPLGPKDYYKLRELPAYQWELTNANSTGLDAIELQDVQTAIQKINNGEEP